ncbi:MAG: hypothetical protein DHS20C11_15450 [Lysobacteraceae bacterium]|nr:MAG: hypothetical protein DHS20C11_15450 [Xanthomonadaceae bacterium]
MNIRLSSFRTTTLRTCVSVLLAAFLVGCEDQSTASTATSGTSEDGAIAAPSVDLHTAVVAGDVAVVKAHIAAGSDLNVAEPFGGSSPLISAALFGQTEIAIVLIDAGADLDVTNGDGSTALHTAAFFGRPQIVDALLQHGVNTTIKNNYGSTAYDSVAAPFDQVKPFYDAIGQSLAPMGLKLDYEQLKTVRPVIAAKLQL